MGHRFSKSTAAVAHPASNGTTKNSNNNTNQKEKQTSKHLSLPALVGPTINLQIEDNPTSTATATIVPQLSNSSSSSLSSINTCSRQIIIKIQLAKMENGNEQIQTDSAPMQQHDVNLNSSSSSSSCSGSSRQMQQQPLETNAQILNLTLNRNYPISCDAANRVSNTPGAHTSELNHRTAGSSFITTNNFTVNSEQNINDLSSRTAGHCEILAGAVASQNSSWIIAEPRGSAAEEANASRSRKSKEPQHSHSSSNREQIYASNATLTPSTCPSSSQQQRLSLNNNNNSIMVNTTVTSSMPITVAGSSGTTVANNNNHSNQLTLWTPNSHNADISLPVNAPRVVVVQCQCPTSFIYHSNNGSAAVAPALNATTTPKTTALQTHTNCTVAAGGGPIVHSQVDFVHYLVPDLEKITNSNFYWGKMDRYEAERLLDGKPEGTFLLRDSAQEEFLFSVTFRKYGRSLHARIEQSGHKFSFDCHDPHVFTATTVTGLLEHYKDPTCVMFFEPMLTIPLHRKTTFSLQQLCRATIVSHTSYDGINQMELPARLKSYLKEYHYKQKLRVKPFDEPFYYSCT